jgi:hypothetical protein
LFLWFLVSWPFVDMACGPPAYFTMKRFVL